jgi:membrane dipeptidase
MPTIPYFDGHNDALLRLYLDRSERGIERFLAGGGPGHLDLPRARAGHFVGGLFATFSPPLPKEADAGSARPALPTELSPSLSREQAADAIVGEAALLFRLIAASDGQLALCRSVAEIRAAIAAEKIAVVLHMEGADAIGPDFYMLDVLVEAGLRSLGPVWSRANIFGHGVPFAFPGSPNVGPGLTDDGKRLVAECNRRRLLIDVSHLNEAGFWDVAALSDAPLVASHSNVHAISPSPRNLTEQQLDAISAHDGFVGLNFATSFLRPDGQMRADTEIELMVRHLDALIERLGEDRVGLGSDFDGAGVPAAIGSVAGVPALFEALRAHGYGEELLRKIGSENWLRVLEKTWGK